MLTIVDYGVGNVGSIKNMIKHVGGDAIVARAPEDLEHATQIVLPGVGNFGHAMDLLNDGGWSAALTSCALQKRIPTLGICLGMQLMTRGSEESPGVEGLSWIEADTVRFDDARDRRLKIPHMGWNVVTPRQNSLLLDQSGQESRFYFVHSYHVRCDRDEDIAGTTIHGRLFTSCIQRRNLFGFQPHPEKSHKFGMSVFRKFVEIGKKRC